MSVIEIQNFSKQYGRFTAVQNLSLTVPSGKIVGFVGKNGAGKSTTLRSMLDMIHVSSGKITLFGLDSRKDTKELKRKVAYIPSEAQFYEHITGRALLNFAIQFSDVHPEKIDELARYFELDLSKKISELSFGNRKKLSLVQGLVKNCALIILDEPTNGLDPLMQRKFFDWLLREKQEGKTVFLSSHNLAEIDKYCDMLAVIKDGKLVDYLDMADVKIRYRQVVSYQTTDGHSESYEVDGDINALVAKLAGLQLSSLEIKTKSVEDEFIDYYKEDKR